MIETNYAEYPEQCEQEIYRAGRAAYLAAASLWMQRN